MNRRDEFFVRWSGGTLRERVGRAMFIAIVVHLFLARRGDSLWLLCNDSDRGPR